MHLTKPQKLIYDMEKFAGGAIAVIGGSMLINGKKDLSEIKRAVNEIYRLNDALRIRISESDGEISQSVTEYIERNIEVLYFDNKAELDRYAENYAKTPINFYGNLCEINIVILPEQYGLLVKLHHIISDAWTLSLIGNQFNALLNGDIPEAYSYTNYIESENTYLNSKRYAKDRAYFLEQFKKCDEVTYINEKSTDSLSACRKTFVIDLEKAKQITDYAQQSGTSAFMLFTAALSTYINRTKMNAEKFYIGTAVLNRNGIKENNTAGMFVNTVPMLIELDNTKSFSDNLSAIESTAFSIFRHQKYNYGDVLSAIRKEYSFTEKLYDVMISYQNATIVGTDIETTWYHSGMQNESLQIHIDDRDNEGIFRIHYDYQTEKFTEYDIDMLHQHICNLIFDAVKNDTKKLYELELLTADEKQKLLYEFNDTAVDYQKDKCVHHLFEEQVEKTPNKIAVIACDRTLTYAELNEQANRIAHSLIEKGVKQGDIVAFMLPRKSYLIAAMFGILKSGAAYLPIDPDYPQDRIEYMLSDSKAKFCVTEENINDLISNSCADNLTIAISSENLCYCIYTSGSTGKPKGTVLTHRNVCNYCDNNNNNVVHRIIKDSYKNIVSVTTVGFDIFVTESLLPLTNGMEVLLANEEQAKLQSEFNDLIKSNSADVMQTTPTKMKSLIADKTQLDYLKTVKVIILGGEALDSSLVEELKKLTDAEIFNIYGPTETTVWVANAEIKKSKCLFELFEGQVGKTPDKTAIIACDRTLTYSELNEEANKIAHSLIDQGVKVGDIVAFMLPRKSHLIATLLGILKAGAAYLPIDPDYPQDRIEYMLEDSKAKLCIDENNVKSLLDNNKTENPYVKVSSESLFCCIYTSGSTGQPKGVILNHRNFCNYFSKHIYIDSIRKCTSVFCISNVIFDMFINEVFSALLFGLTLILASESDIHSPQYLSDLIIKYQIESMICTPTKFSIYLNDKNFQSALSNVKLLTFGGEILTEELCNNIATDSNAMVINGYGPTGTTIVSSYGETIKNDITIGKPIANTQIYIVDKYMCPTPIGVTGELCIAGDGVGAGYLNRPELTAEKFIDNPFGKGKLYKTGDLAYWRKDGNIVYVGRNDFQVKIRGLRIELGEIENAICSMDGISHAVVVVRKNTEGRQLICAFYSGTEIDAKNIRSHIGKKLPKYMLPHIFTHLDEMPLTSSGKINRKALPEVDLYAFDTTVEYIAPQTEREKILVSAVEATLSIDKVGIMDNFFDIGGDSLKAIELISKLEKQGYHTDTKTIFDCDTVKELAQRLTVAETAEEIFNFFGDIPATDAQMRVYTAQNMYKDSTIYNVPYVFKADKVDIDRLQAAVNKLIDRHEILRTHFENKDGNIIQVVNSNAVSEVEILKSDDITSFIRPFDLTKSPLLRVGIYENTVMIDMHHIITDGGSMPVFFKELNELYMGRELNNAPVQYKQFSVRRQDHTESEQYWLSVFNDEIPILEINTDFKRGQKQTFNGSAIYDSIDIELHNKILAFCKEQNITPFIFYMGAFNILLSKFSGNEDIVVGMPISGRDAKYLGTIGMFVNTVALRNKPVGTKTITEFLQEVKENSVNAINHQDYPYGELVKKLNINTANRNPLFDVMFAYQSEQMTDVVFGDKKAELLPVPITTSKYDFTFNIMPRANDVVIMAEYCTDLYKENTLHRLVESYKYVLNQLLNSNAEIKDITAATKQEQQKLLYDFNDTAVDYPKDKCVHQLFEEQVEKTPDKTAVIACDKTLTYKELNEQANCIAHSLIEKGVGVGDIVAFMLPRKSYLIATMFGLLKSGAAYLPIDPDYPQDRIEYMLSDSKAKFCVTEENINDLISNSCVDNPNIAISSENLCYCIYTSGSTGKPKGTVLTHRNVCNYCDNNNNNNVVHRIIKDSYKNIVSVTTVGFDIFVTESLLPLTNGMEVLLANEEQAKLQSKFNDLIMSNPADVMQTTPTKMKSLIADTTQLDCLKTIQAIILGGEALDNSLVEELKKITNAEIFNIYGPTETTVWSANAHIEQQSCLYEYFEEHAERTPNKVAVVFKNNPLTYSKLKELVNEYCAKLQAIGVEKGSTVAIHLNRSYELIVFQLAVLKAGGIFLPVDKRYPKDRIEYMCEDCNVSTLITDESNRIENTKTLHIDEFKNIHSQKEAEAVFNNDVCYIIYTSGSTGTPKGCMLKGSGLVNFCKNNNILKILKKKENNIFACVNSVSFDYFIAESLLPLLNGYTTVILDDEESINQKQFLDIASKQNINVLMTTPTRLKIFFDDRIDCDYLKQLTCICTSGEALPTDLLSIMYSKAPNAQVCNPLGPSECTVWNVGGELDKSNDIDIHIGKPIANTQIYIVDKYMKPTPIGVTGELCIAGDGVGAGYLNRPELTAEKFIDNPFGEGKLYKTGDLAYWREDGNIVYVGRNDFQVKIRGLRIELGEIENAICGADGISQAVVVVRKNNEGRQLICAFYTGTEIDAKEIRSHIGKNLPKYMLPHIFTHLDEMPLTSSGKINRKALPEVDLYAVDTIVEYIAPTTPLQKALCEFLANTLKIERVGITDNFFDIGCDSLKAIEFVAMAHNSDIEIALQNVFDYPTVQALSDYLRSKNIIKIKFNPDDFKKYDKLLQNNIITDTVLRKKSLGNVLITGATGFLGIHILAEFLEQENGTAYCLVRGKNNSDAENRLSDTLEYYFDNKYSNLLGKRIVALCGDITETNLGLDDMSEVNTVIHTAATVKHYGTYDYFENINVSGTRNVIAFAKELNAKLIHISTIGVSGNSLADDFDVHKSKDELFFDETCLYIGQPLDNVYVRSKFEAERAVLDAIIDGLDAKILRVGNLTNRASDLKFQPNYAENAFLKRFKAFIEAGIFPDYFMHYASEFSPIDKTAQAVIKVAQYADRQCVFHLGSNKEIEFEKLFGILKLIGIGVSIVSGDEFSRMLNDFLKSDLTRYIYETFQTDIDENGKLLYDSNIRIGKDFSIDFLQKVGFEWNDIDFDYISRYVEYFRKLGYLK